MYSLSPFTWLIGSWAGTGLENRNVVCAQNELAVFDPPSGQTCASYMRRYLDGGAPGSLLNPAATLSCEYCPIRNANQFFVAYWIHSPQFGGSYVVLLRFSSEAGIDQEYEEGEESGPEGEERECG
jgi:ABC-type multidrug transport system permease subunit